jgi:hypothetical protein
LICTVLPVHRINLTSATVTVKQDYGLILRIKQELLIFGKKLQEDTPIKNGLAVTI